MARAILTPHAHCCAADKLHGVFVKTNGRNTTVAILQAGIKAERMQVLMQRSASKWCAQA
jgi:hypothetical protein